MEILHFYKTVVNEWSLGVNLVTLRLVITVFDVITAHALISAPPPYEKSKKKKKVFCKV